MSISGSTFSAYAPLLVIGSGIIGSITRYTVSELYIHYIEVYMHKYKHVGYDDGTYKHKLILYMHSVNYPASTLTVNLVGSFIGGIVVGSIVQYNLCSNVQVLLQIGLLGCLTTQSSYILELYTMCCKSAYTRAILYILISNIFGISLFVCGVLCIDHTLIF